MVMQSRIKKCSALCTDCVLGFTFFFTGGSTPTGPVRDEKEYFRQIFFNAERTTKRDIS